MEKETSPAVVHARAYKERAEINTPELSGLLVPDETYLKRVADYLEQAAHAPGKPEVCRAYAALIQETLAQFAAMKGITVAPWDDTGEPYANSREMRRDVTENRHLFFFRTVNGFGEGETAQHPMLAPSGHCDAQGRPLLVNDIFRIVHDYFGHTQRGFSFGPKGEYSAFQEHARMYSKAALPALAAETLAQNAWVNYGPHMRRPDGTVPRPGEPDYVPPRNRRFADQKAFVVPWDLLAQDPNPESITRSIPLR